MKYEWIKHFGLSPACCVQSGEAENTYITDSGLTLPGIEPKIYLR
jgi:hypothetical protein